MATMSHLFFYWLALIALVWLFLMLHSAWPRERAKHPQPAEREPLTSKRTCSKEPKPFAGLTQRPQCALCEREAAHPCGTMGSTAAWNRPPQPVAFAHGHWRPATAGGARSWGETGYSRARHASAPSPPAPAALWYRHAKLRATTRPPASPSPK
jgi:hypothetical protein